MTPPRTKRWRLKEVPDAAAESALTTDRCPASLARVLAQRGVRDPKEAARFFRPHIEQLHDPFLMADMLEAVERIERALGEGERIMVYGDYDVDGTTAVALVTSFLSRFSGHLIFYIPDRYAEGYGISFQGIDHAKQEGVTLIIALDCGIKSHDKVVYASEKGIDFIICDHHRPDDTLPAAVAVLDPKRTDCGYPFKELSGCGIGFKLMQGLAQRNNIPFAELEPLLDLVAVSTACDIVPVVGENRVLAHFGLRRLNEEPRAGFQAMLEMANVKRALNVTDLVFVLGPRINAAGRIEHGRQAVELLLAHDKPQAEQMSARIDRNNVQRQDLDKEITRGAMEMIERDAFLQSSWSTVLFDATWHKGVIGIVASRLIDVHYRPTVVLTESNGKATGSARSVKGFDVYEAINACADLLDQFGGHTYAAGLSMPLENVEAFRTRFEAVVRERLGEEQRTREEEVDVEITLADIDGRLMKVLQHMAPYGPGNMKPVFLTRGVKDKGHARIVGESHLKMNLIDPDHPQREIDAIAFRQAEHMELVRSGEPFSVIYTLEDNLWNGRSTIQMNIKDIKPGVEGLLMNESAGHHTAALV
ncbi:MAG: single-stranded-DNA-specific exonuclease RecJ [Flavobacteriales bacterium]|nr:single-stranded-DNA-specific exonuclease RecJ [Flavobacteriales bacterium]